MGAGELAHVFFSLDVGCKTALADKLDFMPVFEIDMAAPCPCIGVRIFLHYADEWLIAMGILYSIPLPVFRAGLHTTTVVVVGGHSKRINRLKLRDSMSGAPELVNEVPAQRSYRQNCRSARSDFVRPLGLRLFSGVPANADG